MNEVGLLLRAEGRYATSARGVPWRHLVVIGTVGCAAYGAVMGAHALRPLQVFYSCFKVPLLLALSTLLCLPSFFVLNTVLGLRDDFAAACRGVLAAQATIGVVLLSLVPVLLVVYLGTPAYRLVQLLNGLLFLVATVAGQVTLGRHYRALIARSPRHRVTYYGWVLLYVFVAIQMAWVLRPFIGNPRLPVGLLRPDPWNNAYLEIWGILTRVLTRAFG